MEWKLSAEQQDYQESLRGWLGDLSASEGIRAWHDVEDRGDASVFEAELARGGMAGVGVPEEWGGQGGGVVELALTAEELSRAGVPSAAWLASTIALPAVAGLPELARQAVAGEPVAMLITADTVPGLVGATSIDTDGRVTGSVARVLAGDRAATFVAPVSGPDGTHELRVVAAGASGVEVEPRHLLDRTRSVADVRLDAVDSRPLAGDPSTALEGVADLSGVLVAADALGAMERMLDLAVQHSLQREQFGVPIGSFQAVKHAAASILVDVESGRAAVYYAAASLDAQDDQRALHAAAVKAQVTAAAARAADTALTMHGAIGYTWEHELHRHYKRARLDAVLFGSAASWNERVASGLSLL
jgi:alkylation response protein AidB-like acyl-CoA dehydrogenase